jgi:hypothetical protein
VKASSNGDPSQANEIEGPLFSEIYQNYGGHIREKLNPYAESFINFSDWKRICGRARMEK